MVVYPAVTTWFILFLFIFFIAEPNRSYDLQNPTWILKPFKAKNELYHKIYVGKARLQVFQLVILSSIDWNKVKQSWTQSVQQERRVKPTGETWGNRVVMRDGYQRHPATHMVVHSNPHTHQCTWTIKNAHDYRHTNQERVRMQTITLTRTCTHPIYKTPVVRINTFVSVHIDHIN